MSIKYNEYINKIIEVGKKELCTSQMHISVTSGQHNGISGHLVESLNKRYSLIKSKRGS